MGRILIFALFWLKLLANLKVEELGLARFEDQHDAIAGQVFIMLVICRCHDVNL